MAKLEHTIYENTKHRERILAWCPETTEYETPDYDPELKERICAQCGEVLPGLAKEDRE